uniref:receptor protein-tyrosine kinase n=1 Tax=Panagrolaimus davidi TaxID=227884 RepID=A0A914P4R7_9BILA
MCVKTAAAEKMSSDMWDKKKHCAGTINGGNVISTSESHYERLAKYYENCTVITGNLELTHVTKNDIEKADAKYTTNVNGKTYKRRPFWFLQNVREISGYLLVFYVYTETVELPNLKIIRGRHLFEGNGLYINRNGIKYLKMPKLRSVLKGGITVSSMSKAPLCYLYHTIDFDHLKGDSSANITIIGKHNPIDGSDICKPEQYECHSRCAGFCFGPSLTDCQELYRVDCPVGCHSCFTGPNGTKHCCHSECAAGCTGLGPKRCVSCQNYNQDGECVPECNGLEKYDREQSKIVPREKDERRYFYESYCLKECPDKTLIEGKYCVVSCQAGHYRNVDIDRRKCVPCDGPCPKVCAVPKYLDVQMLKELVNCSEIDGNLELLNHLYEEPGYEPSLLNNLRSVKIVTGYVMVDGGGIPNDKKPTNLKFLENLKVIEGRDLHIRYSLVVQGLANLTELGLRKLEKLSAGKAVFLNNSQLCYGKNLDWKFLNAEGVQFTHNAPPDFCAKYDYICHDTCDPTKGCWGKGPSQCLKCQHYIKDDECVNTCEEAEGLFRVGKNECHRCDRECSTCYGPTAFECKTCKNYRFEDIDTARFQCVEKCPNNTYAYQNDCYPCHDNCYNNGCNGESAILGRGCKACRFGVHTDEGIQCLAGSDVMNACHHWDGYYPDLPSTIGIQTGECKKCRPECKTCISLNNCTECQKYKVVPNNDTEKMIGCAEQCGE